MTLTDLPPEILIKIFQHFKDDYQSLYNYILVNKLLHYYNIQKLWRDPFYSTDSTKIIINFLLIKDPNFFVNNNIKLKPKEFERLKKSLLHNYIKFTTKIDYRRIS